MTEITWEMLKEKELKLRKGIEELNLQITRHEESQTVLLVKTNRLRLKQMELEDKHKKLFGDNK